MTSLSDPPCLIEHELYVETLFGFFIRCPHGNVHQMSVSVPGGGVLSYFYTYVGLGHFWGAQNLEFQFFLGVFRRMNIFWGV